MFGVEKRLEEEVSDEDLPPGMYDGEVSLDCEIDYKLLTEILPTRALIRLYESVSGIKVPDKYKKGLEIWILFI